MKLKFRREPIRDKERLLHILQAINNIEEGLKKHDFNEITNDKIVYFGFVKQLEIIGEDSYKLTKEFRENHPQTPWNKIEGMRHVLVHGYYSINVNQFFRVITNDLPTLLPQKERYITELS
ncbi:MAG: DUF86 domain-containing protein [Paludibacteraceae bacterium]|nr:DUF86 domain-containing protein [Paludibacteraceae bacterium]